MSAAMRKLIAKAFNQWMRDYTENPEAFEDISRSAMKFLNDQLGGNEPTYGDECAALLMEYMDKADKESATDGVVSIVAGDNPSAPMMQVSFTCEQSSELIDEIIRARQDGL